MSGRPGAFGPGSIVGTADVLNHRMFRLMFYSPRIAPNTGLDRQQTRFGLVAPHRNNVLDD
jgi:hypothetical protein